MFDYSFFALLFLLASSLAPNAGQERTWVNARHPEQTITFTASGDGGWEMSVNGREMGFFHRDGGAIIHHTGTNAPERFEVDRLAGDVPPDASRIPLRGHFASRVLEVRRDSGQTRLVDPSRQLLRTELILRTR